LCTDFMHPPELLPFEALNEDSPRRHPTFRLLIGPAKDIFVSKDVDWVASLLALPPLLFGYLPSAVYRVTFKATALAYAPFVWAAHSTLSNQLSAKDRLERITKGEFEKTRRYLSGFVLGLC